MDDLLSDDDIRRNMPMSNESRLSLANIIGEVIFNSISQRFSYYFIDDITQANRSIILGNNRIILFGNESVKSFIQISR